ncbi:response regulator [Marinobacter nauticus]|uniref:response regulator n=1 Tax=Marinobacter nauticus TaxID=2743 RepID=UPI001CFE1B42|nr:response regulator [Marinobacter nauticus]
MNVLLLEDDDLVADLLETVVAGSYPGAFVQKASNLAQAFDKVADATFGLIITDWNLPDGSGLELVRKVRARDTELPIVMVSARADRDSVLKAAHYGISGYITKPFDVAMVHKRLAELIEPGPVSGVPELQDVLKSSLDRVIQLPGDLDAPEVLELMARADELSPGQLAERWREHPGLVTRLLDVANSSSFRRSGKPVESLKDALSLLGVGMALNQALAMALDVSRVLQNPQLAELAVAHQDQAVRVGREAQRLALRLKKSPVMCQKAGLLSRIGELAVLRVLNQFLARGGSLEEGEAERCLRDWAQPYGNRLKVQWRIPLGLREMIGAVHFLPKDCTREDRLIMRTAALIAEGQQEMEECQRLLRRLGLDTVNTSPERDE